VTQYAHTQIGHVIVWPLVGVIVLIEIIGFVGSSPHREIPAFVLILLLVSLALFYKLTITIEGDTLRSSFRFGIIRKNIRLADIAGCEAIRTRWWYGWGIHLTPYGWLYNVSGLHAVAITLRNGRKFALGTDEPDGLAEAIRQSIGRK
jgi:hypothetical protein